MYVLRLNKLHLKLCTAQHVRGAEQKIPYCHSNVDDYCTSFTCFDMFKGYRENTRQEKRTGVKKERDRE